MATRRGRVRKVHEQDRVDVLGSGCLVERGAIRVDVEERIRGGKGTKGRLHYRLDVGRIQNDEPVDGHLSQASESQSCSGRDHSLLSFGLTVSARTAHSLAQEWLLPLSDKVASTKMPITTLFVNNIGFDQHEHDYPMQVTVSMPPPSRGTSRLTSTRCIYTGYTACLSL